MTSSRCVEWRLVVSFYSAVHLLLVMVVFKYFMEMERWGWAPGMDVFSFALGIYHVLFRHQVRGPYAGARLLLDAIWTVPNWMKADSRSSSVQSVIGRLTMPRIDTVSVRVVVMYAYFSNMLSESSDANDNTKCLAVLTSTLVYI